ncbi:hypothetical protein DO72_385 [Burkholderia pseudomallei]|nr:hypothetical protein DO72_385 [Burkholderia pseudomallei]
MDVPTLASRKTTISLNERAPWYPEQTTIRQLSLFAEFERLKDGLSQPERDRRLARAQHSTQIELSASLGVARGQGVAPHLPDLRWVRP